MKLPPTPHPGPAGATLIEAVIAIGVLAVAIPMVFGALAESGKSGMSAQAETRSTWIVPACMDEIRASREGHPRYFTPTTVGQSFPAGGEVWAIAFSADGKPIGKISKADYETGIRDLGEKKVRYIATISSASPTTVKTGTPVMLRVDINLEYPAAVKSAKRQKLDFHTRIP